MLPSYVHTFGSSSGAEVVELRTLQQAMDQYAVKVNKSIMVGRLEHTDAAHQDETVVEIIDLVIP